MKQVLLAATLAPLTGMALADELQPTGPGSDVWEKYVKDRPCPRVLAEYQVVTAQLVPIRGEIKGYAAVVLSSSFAGGYRNLTARQLTLDSFLAYATQVKGGTLTEKERERVGKLYAKYASSPDENGGVPPHYFTFFTGEAYALGRKLGTQPVWTKPWPKWLRYSDVYALLRKAPIATLISTRMR